MKRVLIILFLLLFLIFPATAIITRTDYMDGPFNVTIFDGNGTSFFIVPSGVTNIDYLVVSPGGNGGASRGGGGGAGGLNNGTLAVSPGDNKTVLLGNLGSGGVNYTIVRGVAGTNSTWDTISPSPGGPGGGQGDATKNGLPGGSGGGGTGDGATGSGLGATGYPPQGNAGGYGNNSAAAYGGGGGGGFGSNGVGGTSSAGGPGGSCASNNITGTPTAYACGGNGGSSSSTGTIRTAKGSGGAGGLAGAGGTTGIDGIIVLRYLVSASTPTPTPTPTTTTTGGGYTFSTGCSFYNLTNTTQGFNATNWAAQSGLVTWGVMETNHTHGNVSWWVCIATETTPVTPGWQPNINPTTDTHKNWWIHFLEWWWLPLLILVMMILFNDRR